MSENAEELAASVMSLIRSPGPAAAATGETADLAAVQSAVRFLCEIVAKQERELNRLSGMPGAGQHEPGARAFVPLQPREWRFELTPDLPQWPANGHSLDRSKDDRPN